MIRFYNSLSQQKQDFMPLEAKKVGLYACGMTVYDYCHIGHARSLIVFDMIVRYFRFRGYQVNYVRNITDIDDKIIKRASELKEDWQKLTERFIQAMHEDERALGIVSPDHEPRATDHISAIIILIQQIIDNDSAYVASNGDVCFDISGSPEYGKLSNRDIDKLISGARVEVQEGKRSPLDFVLWKLAKPTEPQWDSPWGAGRPGWHIECSAMSSELLGQPFDIHAGGMDLKFPHHENEIAQSEAACGCAYAHYWMHAGLLNINGEKMSKSLGNFFTIREVLEKYDAEVIRYFMLSGLYRSPLNYSEDNMQQALSSLERLYTCLRGLPETDPVKDSSFEQRFLQVMDDDFNSPEALAVLFDLAREVNRLKDQGQQAEAASHAALLKSLADIFGILQHDPNIFLQGDADQEDLQKIESLIAERNQARDQKDWVRADEIRDELLNMNVAIEDGAGGTIWRRIKS